MNIQLRRVPGWPGLGVGLLLWGAVAGASEPPETTLAPITVRATKLEQTISTTTLSTAEIKSVPGSVDDPLRAAKVVPACTTESDFDTRLFIRGSAPEDSLVLVDGLAAGFPFHFYGLSSTLDINTLKTMRIFSGGFPVEYGNYMGGIIDVQTKPVLQPEAKFNFNVIQAGLYYQTPVGERGNLQGSFRRGFYNLVLSDWHEAVILPSYYDYFFKAGWEGLQVYVWGSEDYASIRSHLPSGENGVADLRQKAHTTALTYTVQAGELEIVTQGRFSLEGQNYYFDRQNYFEQDPKTLSAQGVVRSTLLRDHTLQWGWEFGYQEPTVNIRVSDFFDASQKYLSPGQAVFMADTVAYHRYATYLSDRVMLSPDCTAEVGARCDYTTFNHKGYLSPRAQVEYELGSGQRVRAACGVFDQEPIPLMMVGEADSDRGAVTYNQAVHYIASYEAGAGPWQHGLEVYAKEFLRLNSLSSQNSFSTDGKGYARGVEYKAQYAWQRAGKTIVTYVWSESKRYLPEKEVWILFDNDRTHQFALWHQVSLTPQWSGALRWAYATGQPYTEPGLDSPSGINGRRLPEYQRLDARIQYRTTYKRTEWEFGLDVFNLYNAHNYSRIMFNNLYSSTTYFAQFPLLLVLGLSVTL